MSFQQYFKQLTYIHVFHSNINTNLNTNKMLVLQYARVTMKLMTHKKFTEKFWCFFCGLKMLVLMLEWNRWMYINFWYYCLKHNCSWHVVIIIIPKSIKLLYCFEYAVYFISWYRKNLPLHVVYLFMMVHYPNFSGLVLDFYHYSNQNCNYYSIYHLSMFFVYALMFDFVHQATFAIHGD